MRVNKEKELKIDTTIEKLLGYCPDCGNVFWKIGRGNQYTYPGKTAGSLHSSGYQIIESSKMNFFTHRVAWRLYTGKWPTDRIDHIDGNRLNNKIVNLREVTDRENNLNTHKHRSGKLVGANWDKSENKYISAININGKQTYIGRFKTAKEANAAYLKKLSGIESI